MRIIADFHTHSRFAMACSQNITLRGMESAALEKGIGLIGTADFLHGSWLSEIKSTLEEDSDTGLFKIKGTGSGVRFILSTEVSTVFTAKNGAVKKIHHCITLPSIDSVTTLKDALSKYGALESDGRPTLSMSAAELVEKVFGVDKNAFVFPAHAWTPYFGALGSLSGFDSIKDTYQDQEKHIFSIETGLSCYDEETEVLTEDGWKRFKKLKYSDAVCTLNPETNNIEFQKPIRITGSEYSGKMYRLKTKRIDLLVTPNHKLFYAPFASHAPIKFYLEEASHLFGRSKTFKKGGSWSGETSKFFRLPPVKIKHGSRYYSGFRSKESKLLPIKTWLKFFGFWIAEGHTTKERSRSSYAVVISNTDRKLITKMKSLLKKVGYNPYLYYNKISRCYQLRVRDFQLFSYLNQFGKSYQKFVPKEIKSLPKEHLSTFFKYYIKGDGHIYGRTGQGLSATTNSIKLRDDLQEIALKLGMSAYYKLSAKKGTPLTSLNKAQYKSTHDAWVVYFIRHNLHSIVPSLIKKYHQIERWINFVGNVYCVTVPNHVIYVRRNGIPVWCGNSDPPMNWRVSKLDKYTLISNSDMHSLPKLGREANVFEIDEKLFDYPAVIGAIKERNGSFKGTIEFYPEEGKYHYDGHRICKFSANPSSGITKCPVCGRHLLVGVLHRVLDLADRPDGYKPTNAPPYMHLVPLIEIIAYVLRKNVYSVPVETQYKKLVEHFGTEFKVLIDANPDEISEQSSNEIAQAIENVRDNKINIIPGYAGVFGELDLLGRGKKDGRRTGSQKSLAV